MQARGAAIRERPLATPVGLGMVLFLVSEGFLFGALFIIYYYLRAYSLPNWPPAGVELHLLIPTVNTFVLLASSLTFFLAIRSIRQGSPSALAGWLAGTAVLGVLFVGLKLYEWTSNTFGPWNHAYGSIYYTLTGFHAVHVLAGVGIVLALLVRALRGRFSATRHLAVEVGGLYWHFVDGVWLVVYSTIFLIR